MENYKLNSAETIHALVAEFCQRQSNDVQLLPQEQKLLIQISDMILFLDNKVFLSIATLRNRCDFILANKQHIQTIFQDMQSPDIKVRFSKEELSQIANADAYERGGILENILTNHGLNVTPATKALLVSASSMIAMGFLYYATNSLASGVMSLASTAMNSLYSNLPTQIAIINALWWT